MAYFKLSCRIKFGEKFILNGVHSIEIVKSLFSLSESCKIMLPTFVTTENDLKVERIKLSTILEKGQKISVEIGYDNKLKKEFEGFITDITEDSPILVICNGYSYTLQRHVLDGKSWRKTTLKEVLNYAIENTGIVLEDKITDFEMTSVVIHRNTRAIQVIEFLKEKYLLSGYMKGNKLFVGLLQLQIYGTVKYNLIKNVISKNDLKWVHSDDVKFSISIRNTKTQVSEIVEYGKPDGRLVKIDSNGYTTDQKEFVSKLLKSKHDEKLGGYTGSFETFLIPYSEPGFKCQIENPTYPARNGLYFISSVKTTFGINGARRDVEINGKLSI